MINNVSAEFMVADFDAAVQWYGSFFGRPPDRRPMDGLVEWQLTDSDGVQVFESAEHRGNTNVTIGVDDVDAHVVDLASRGLGAEAFDTDSGGFRLAVIEDADGNTVALAQDLRGSSGS